MHETRCMHAHHTIRNSVMIIQGLIRARHGVEELKVYDEHLKNIVVALDYCDCGSSQEDYREKDKGDS